MGRDDRSKPPGKDVPTVSYPARPRTRPNRQLSLRHIMIAMVYFAIVLWIGRGVYEAEGVGQEVLLGVLIGLGIAAFGALAAYRMTRFSFIGWIFFVIGYMTITGSTISFFAIPSLPVLIGSIIYLHYRRRSAYQDALLGVMTVAAGRGMPLDPGIAAFSDQSAGIFQVWAESLAELLRRGSTLPDAIDSLPKVVPKEAPILIRMGWESGDLAAGLRAAVGLRTRRDTVLRTFGARVAYLFWVLCIGEGVVSFVLYFVLPKFEAIFEDFGVSLPTVTTYVVRLSHALIQYGPLGGLVQLAVFVYLILVFVGWGNMNIPLIDRLFRRRHSALILRCLAVAVDAGRPIGPALDCLAMWYPTRWVRRKLADASAYARQGIDWVEAMHSTGLFSASDVGVLGSARRAGNLGWAFRELAETGERRFGYRLQAWSQILFVLVVLGIGGLVCLIAVAYFSPLTTLISRLAE